MPKMKETKQRLPDNWDHEGLSKGKQTGPVRKTPDAYNESKERQKQQTK
jgi:hypothetical protein